MILAKQMYRGDGTTVASRGLRPPSFVPNLKLLDPAGYRPASELADAVNVAIVLGQPLLLTGEPGTGKTQLAYSVARELEMFPPLVFQTKTNSGYADLFYRYDMLRHFQDVQLRASPRPLDDYMEFGPLGRAIHLAMDRKDPSCPADLRTTPQRRSVVLIDEMDKASRDFANDILVEIEQMLFQVRETGKTYSADQSFRPILVLTSNLEKDLPDAFRRRCIFYHITFPDREQLLKIVSQRLDVNPAFSKGKLKHAIDLFLSIRNLPMDKPPATAELIGWIDLLQRLDLDVGDGVSLSSEQKAALAFSYSVLAKSVEDLKLARSSVYARE